MSKFAEKERNQLVGKITNHIKNCDICSNYRISKEVLNTHLKLENSGHLGWALDELVKKGKLTKIKTANRWYYYLRN